MPDAYPFADLALARRLEHAEGAANAACVEARARLAPDVGACWREVGGAYAMFDGPGSFLTQTFGLGLFADATDEVLDTVERFFGERGAGVAHETSPLATPALAGALVARGYRPTEFTSVLFRPIDPATPMPASEVTARPVARDDAATWADASARGWAEDPAAADFLRDFAVVAANASTAHPFVAELDGRVVGSGGLMVHEGVALLSGASTIPAWRGRGAQAVLLAARLRHAAALGCDLAMMGALPGSTSQRNAERRGFRIAYTRTKWERPLA